MLTGTIREIIQPMLADREDVEQSGLLRRGSSGTARRIVSDSESEKTLAHEEAECESDNSWIDHSDGDDLQALGAVGKDLILRKMIGLEDDSGMNNETWASRVNCTREKPADALTADARRKEADDKEPEASH